MTLGTTLKAFQTIKRVVPANGDALIDIRGTYIAVLSATGAFRVRLDANPMVDFQAGLKAILPPDEEFKQVTIRDISGGPNTVEIIVGFGDFEDARLTVSGALSVSKASNFASVPDVVIVTVTNAQVAAVDPTRRELIVKSLSANVAPFRIGDAGAAAGEGHELMPGETIILTTTAEVRAFNTHTANQTLSVVEVSD